MRALQKPRTSSRRHAMQRYTLRCAVGWLVGGWILFSPVTVRGQEASLTDPALQTFSPYQQGAPHVTGVEAGMRVDQSTVQQVVVALPTEIRTLVEKGELTFTV